MFFQETVQYQKIIESNLNTVTSCLEDDNNEEVEFKGEMLTLTLQIIKILYNKRVLSNLKVIVTVLEEDTDLVQ